MGCESMANWKTQNSFTEECLAGAVRRGSDKNSHQRTGRGLDVMNGPER